MTKTVSEHVLAVVKASISAIPVYGGPIASLITDYIPTSTERSVREAIEDLGQQITALGKRIDPKAVDLEEFTELFKSSYLVIVRTHHEERRRAAVSLLTNILLRPEDPAKLTYTELDHFARSLEILSIGAIRALGEAVRLAEGGQKTDLEKQSFRFSFEDLHKKMNDLDAFILMGLLGELNGLNLVHLTGVPTARTENYGNYPIELTPLGVKFVRRLLMRD